MMSLKTYSVMMRGHMVIRFQWLKKNLFKISMICVLLLLLPRIAHPLNTDNGIEVTHRPVEVTETLWASDSNEIQESVNNESLTDSQKITNWETLKHIEVVMQLLATMQHEIARRMFSHDRTKLRSPELEMFEIYTDKLASVEYGSEAYEQYRQEMLDTALKHHFEHNRHHPEFFENGVYDMNLIDLIEMLCDWKAASLRVENGDIWQSIEINAERFNITPELVKILQNTVPLLASVYSQPTQKYLDTTWQCGRDVSEDSAEEVRSMCDVQENG